MQYDVIVVGGGASGMSTAILCARKGLRTLVVECADRVLKKVLATGNGKCNFSNVQISPKMYNTHFVTNILNDFGTNEALAFFDSLGIMTAVDDDRLYPYSHQSSTVVNALLDNAKNENVEIKTQELVTSIEKGFIVTTDKGKYNATFVVLATGSNATTGKLSHKLLSHFSHNYGICTPSLTYLMCNKDYVSGLQGIRIKAKATVDTLNNKVERSGELLFKKDAISGIMVFELSSFFARGVVKNKLVHLDLAPDKTAMELSEFLSKHSGELLDGLLGIFPKQLAILIAKKSENRVDKAVKLIKDYAIVIDGIGDIRNAQVVSGGLNVFEFDDVTLESTKVQNLYATGEVLDVDGECGGFNLHWAWASAHAVAKNIGEKYGKTR